MKEATAAQRTAEKIVDHLEKHFGVTTSPYGDQLPQWDHDEARGLIAGFIPLTAAEADEEFDKQMADAERQEQCDHPWHRNPGLINECPECAKKISLPAQLRRALRADDLSLKCMMEAAIAKVRVANAAPDAAYDAFAGWLGPDIWEQAEREFLRILREVGEGEVRCDEENPKPPSESAS